MTRALVLLSLLAPALALALVAPAHAGPARERWTAAFKEAKDARASFRQTRDAGALGKTTAAGTLEFKAPSRVRVEYTGALPLSILLHGDTAWVYQPQQKQVLRSRASASAVPPLPFLTSAPGRLEERYTITEKGSDTIVFSPKEKSAPWTSCTLTIAAQTGLPRRALVRTSDGTSIELVFDRFRVNAGVPASRFHAAWPKGTPVIAL
jgi:outer membrane lipoprotein-sorting protein